MSTTLLKSPSVLADTSHPSSPQPASTARPRPLSTGADIGTRIDVQSLHKTFGSRQVLQDVSLHIAPGEFVAIVGRSGCGKSTLLRLLAGLDRPTAGEVRIDGQPLLQDGTAEQGVRLMFQDARLLPWQTVADNVGLGLKGSDTDTRVQRALRAVGLADRARDWPSALSGGQKQRVALARALVHRPRLLLLDEPLGALDALTRIDMQKLIEDLWREHRFTAVLVTHDVSEAVALADRVLLIEDGALAQDEAVALPRPRQRGQAAFAALEDRVLRRVLQQRVDPERPDTSVSAPIGALPADPRFGAWRWAV